MRGDLDEGGGGLTGVAGGESVDEARATTTTGDRRRKGARGKRGAATTGVLLRSADEVEGAVVAATTRDAEREARMAS
jgi:hypothetical protein